LGLTRSRGLWGICSPLGAAFGAAPLPRSRGCLGLIVTILHEVLGMSGDPNVGKQGPQIDSV
jgi:hypothetical protein